MLLALSPPVALAHRVATVEAVVAELARKSGEDLRMRRELADEVLYVNLKPRPTGELMALVAKTASAEWSREAGHVYLGRSPSFWRRAVEGRRGGDRASLRREPRPPPRPGRRDAVDGRASGGRPGGGVRRQEPDHDGRAD